MHRRTLVGALPALAIPRSFAQGAGAAASQSTNATVGRKFTALSLVGDQAQMLDTTAPLDPAFDAVLPTEAQPVNDMGLDRGALFTINQVLTSSPTQRAAARSFLAASEPAFFRDQEAWFSSGQLTLPPKLQAAVAGESATHLIIVTKRRSKVEKLLHLPMKSKMGDAHVEGLGLYGRFVGGASVEHKPFEFNNLDLLAYAVEVSVVELATSKILAQQASVNAVSTPSAERPVAARAIGFALNGAIVAALPGLLEASA